MAEQRNPQAYAAALLEIMAEPWLKGLRLLNRRIHEQGLSAYFDDRKIDMVEKRARLRPLLADVSFQVGGFAETLAAEGDFHMLDGIVAELEAMVARRSNLVLAHVRSAVPLTPDERKRLEEQLMQRFGNDLEADYEVDPSLIGGVIVRVGDQVIDGSLAGKLNALRERLTA